MSTLLGSMKYVAYVAIVVVFLALLTAVDAQMGMGPAVRMMKEAARKAQLLLWTGPQMPK